MQDSNKLMQLMQQMKSSKAPVVKKETEVTVRPEAKPSDMPLNNTAQSDPFENATDEMLSMLNSEGEDPTMQGKMVDGEMKLSIGGEEITDPEQIMQAIQDYFKRKAADDNNDTDI